MTQNTKPKLYSILKIIGFSIMAVGLILLIVGLTTQSKSMGSAGWFESQSAKFGIIFGGVACLMIATFLIICGFSPEIAKTQIKTKKYIQDENKEDLKSIVDTGVEISKDAITETVKAVKKGIKDSKYCKHCGETIDADSKFCSKCGKEQ